MKLRKLHLRYQKDDVANSQKDIYHLLQNSSYFLDNIYASTQLNFYKKQSNGQIKPVDSLLSLRVF